MEARKYHPVLGLATILFCGLASQAMAQVIRVQQPVVAHSQHFIVFAATEQLASEVSEAAEAYRRDLAVYWLGQELPEWRERCPIHVQASPNLGASGETTFSLNRGTAGGWIMAVHGTKERILDSVLPHEITHTIFATHFAKYGKYVPRWADEGASTTVEHEAEKRKHRHFVHEFLRNGRGLSFNKMFSLKEYPNDILPLYAQGHSAVQFLLDQGGSRKFVQFLEAGMQTEAWEEQLRKAYGYKTIGEFQTLWNQWLANGSPADLTAYAPGLRSGGEGASLALASSQLASSPSPSVAIDADVASSGPFQFAVGNTAAAPVSLAQQTRLSSDPRSLEADSHLQAVRSDATAEELGNESWYKRRLLVVSGGPATPVPVHNAMAQSAMAQSAMAQSAMAQSAMRSMPPRAGGSQEIAGGPQGMSPSASQSGLRQQAARPMPAQSMGVRVLDWGDSVPVEGLQHAGNPRVGGPVLR